MASVTIALPVQDFSLLVHGKHIHCSRRVIVSSSLFLDMVELVEDPSPIPIPTFISRQIMLDLVEMVEKGDWECAHLVLVSLSYLLDFLIAVDFLGCDKIKAVIEDKVRDKITDNNWQEVFHYTKYVLGLDNTTKHVMEHICRSLVTLKSDKDQVCTKEDPYQKEYLEFTPSFLKLMLKTECLGNCLKFSILKKWVGENNELTDHVLDMLKLIHFKDLDDLKVKEIVNEVKMWNISDDDEEKFQEVIANAKKERDWEDLMKKQLAKTRPSQRHGHFMNQDLIFEIPGGPDVFFEL